MTRYTVIAPSGDPIAHGLTLEQAAHEVLQGCHRDYEIRPAAGGRISGYDLWVIPFGGPPCESWPMIYSLLSDEAAARDEIWRRVIDAHWECAPEVMTDDVYAEMMAEFADDAPVVTRLPAVRPITAKTAIVNVED